MNSNKFDLIFTGSLFVLYGVLHIVNFLGLVSINENILLSELLILYGIVIVFRSIFTSKKGRLFFAGTIFLIGVILFVSNIYELIISNKFIVVSCLFILGTDLVILFFDNTKEKVFLITGVFVLSLSFLSLNFYNSIPRIPVLNSIGLILLDIWPALFFLTGIVILATHKW